MNCEEVRRRMTQSAEESIIQTAQEAIAAHVATCPECRRYQDALALSRQAVATLGMESSANGSIARRAVAQFASEPRRAPWLRLWPVYGVGLAAACATALVFVPRNVPTAAPTVASVVPSASRPADRVATLPAIPTPASPATPSSKPIAGAVSTTGLLPSGTPASTPQQRRTPSLPTIPAMSSPSATPRLVRANPPSATPDPVKRPLPNALATSQPIDDLAFLNGGTNGFMDRWTRLTSDESGKILEEVRKSVTRQDDFVDVDPPRLAALDSPEIMRSALAEYRRQLQIVDPRLQRRVHLDVKGMAFGDLCRKLSEATGVEIGAMRNVTDDKVTIFCKDRPVRDIMRQVTNLFNFTWERYGEEGKFTYRLKQPLQAALLEEELRNKDKNEALLALSHEMEAFQPLLGLSPEEAEARVAGMPDGPEKDRMTAMAGKGWGPVQMFALLSPDDLTALRDGQRISSTKGDSKNYVPLPQGMGSTVLRSMPKVRIDDKNGLHLSSDPRGTNNQGVPPIQYPGAEPVVELYLDTSEEGQFGLVGVSGVRVQGPNGGSGAITMGDSLATGISPSARDPKNSEANADQKNLPGMTDKISVDTPASCRHDFGAITEEERAEFEKDPTTRGELRITTADALEAYHKATGEDVMGDYYTRVYMPSVGDVHDLPRFEALCRLSDGLRVRWRREDDWTGFRSTSFFYDRVKEVPNRLLERWRASRKRNRYSTFSDLLEIAALSEIQMKSSLLAEGVQTVYGLKEWALVRQFHPHLRLLSSVGPSAQQSALGPGGMPFLGLTAPQQATFADTLKAYGAGPEDLLAARIWVDYKIPQRTAKIPDKDAPAAKPEEPTMSIRYNWGKPEEGLTEYTLSPGSSEMRRKDKGES